MGNGAPTTIAAIAREAGVSVPTVSKVLNGRPGVSAATRAHIRDLLTEHGYEPRVSRRPAATGLVEFVIRDLESLYGTALLQGAEREAARSAMCAMVTRRPVARPDGVPRDAPDRAAGVDVLMSDPRGERGASRAPA